mmetsp:Transcript_11407/g.44342  ORF Transcript_11407/g.44342 Transcript_11407/m.44342 type:complete len:311 (+) Transcript_11407:177-1109(+)
MQSRCVAPTIRSWTDACATGSAARGFTRWSSWMSSFAGRGTFATRTWNAWTRSSVAPSSDAIRAPIPRRRSRAPSRTPTASSPARVAPSRNGTNASARTTRGWAWRSDSSTTSSAPPRPLRSRRGSRGRRDDATTRNALGVSVDGDGANANDSRGCAGTPGSTRWPSGSASRSSSAPSRRPISNTTTNPTRPTETTTKTTKDGKTSTRTNPTIHLPGGAIPTRRSRRRRRRFGPPPRDSPRGTSHGWLGGTFASPSPTITGSSSTRFAGCAEPRRFASSQASPKPSRSSPGSIPSPRTTVRHPPLKVGVA